MKLIFLTCAVSVLSALSGFAQGTVSFNNDNSTLVVTNDLLGHIGPVRTTDLGRAQLYYSIAVTPPAINTANLLDLTGWTLSSPTTPDQLGIVPGRLLGGTQTLDSAAGSSTVWVMVRGWTGGHSDWASAVNAASQPGSTTFLGLSGTWQQFTGDPTALPPTAPWPMYLGPGGFSLTLSPIPEPSTFALCGLGGIAAAWFTARRRRG